MLKLHGSYFLFTNPILGEWGRSLLLSYIMESKLLRRRLSLEFLLLQRRGSQPWLSHCFQRQYPTPHLLPSFCLFICSSKHNYSYIYLNSKPSKIYHSILSSFSRLIALTQEKPFSSPQGYLKFVLSYHRNTRERFNFDSIYP